MTFPLPTFGLRSLSLLAASAIAAATLSASGPGAQATGATAVSAPVAAKRAANPVTPGDFTGFGFDQCLAPTQRAMNAWRRSSPFSAVGIYISGDSRACRNQPNLTPTWVADQLRLGWRLLPITLGPQASCQPRFPRYSDDVRINPKPGADKLYTTAQRQGLAEAVKTVTDAQALGITRGSTLWYDLEGFDSGNTHCRESALSFLSGWTTRLRALGYVSGVYSSAGSGIAALDQARIKRPNRFVLPDRIWLARWDGVANTSTSYVRSDGWQPGRRIKQYRGGHDEVHGGVRINIDSNYLSLGRGSVAAPEARCGGVGVSFTSYPVIRAPKGDTTPSRAHVKALQCLLQERGLFRGRLTGTYGPTLVTAMNAWQRSQGLPVSRNWHTRPWMTLLAVGARPVLKFGSTGHPVRGVQRTLNASRVGTPVRVTGVYDAATAAKVRAWQAKVKLPVTGVVAGDSWLRLAKGYR
ncbi:glycoside hydrolase domain-containing protein [Nocardioides lijunqiniae]|uniref:glycoside hydrolase domain-containing protein n=1 Tax=Nocardioides lijunqiniae TaxID=2760832 RepID=UPI001877C966|nr:glycoside hydrolase domain-containing protein [Nocardioides lijunqiniae]